MKQEGLIPIGVAQEAEGLVLHFVSLSAGREGRDVIYRLMPTRVQHLPNGQHDSVATPDFGVHDVI